MRGAQGDRGDILLSEKVFFYKESFRECVCEVQTSSAIGDGERCEGFLSKIVEKARALRTSPGKTDDAQKAL